MTKQFLTSALMAIAIGASSAAWADGFAYDGVSETNADFFTAGQRASGVIGKPVLTRDDTKVGYVSDVIFNETNGVAGYIIGVGGFLGIDATSVYVPIDQTDLRIDGISVEVFLNMSDFELKTAANLE